ncbi:Hmgcs1 [Symbiodinium sp. KB8]|nr:Hmgcs1 [Symbiodinium sp. KB8]
MEGEAMEGELGDYAPDASTADLEGLTLQHLVEQELLGHTDQSGHLLMSLDQGPADFITVVTERTSNRPQGIDYAHDILHRLALTIVNETFSAERYGHPATVRWGATSAALEFRDAGRQLTRLADLVVDNLRRDPAEPRTSPPNNAPMHAHYRTWSHRWHGFFGQIVQGVLNHHDEEDRRTRAALQAREDYRRRLEEIQGDTLRVPLLDGVDGATTGHRQLHHCTLVILPQHQVVQKVEQNAGQMQLAGEPLEEVLAEVLGADAASTTTTTMVGWFPWTTSTSTTSVGEIELEEEVDFDGEDFNEAEPPEDHMQEDIDDAEADLREDLVADNGTGVGRIPGVGAPVAEVYHLLRSTGVIPGPRTNMGVDVRPARPSHDALGTPPWRRSTRLPRPKTPPRAPYPAPSILPGARGDVALCTFRGVGYRADYVHVDCVVPCTFRGVRCRADHTYLCGDYLLVLHVVIRGDDLCVDYLDHVDDLDHVDYLAYIAGCRDYFANYLDVVDYVGFFCFACMAVLLCFERHDYVYSYAFLSDLRVFWPLCHSVGSKRLGQEGFNETYRYMPDGNRLPSWNSVGRLDIGTESIIDRSKSMKAYVMDLFERYGSGEGNIEGVDMYNACYGGQAAGLCAQNWVESDRWDGRYGVAIAGDLLEVRHVRQRYTILWLRSHVRREEQFSASELELMSQLGVLLMPDHPIEELFRRFEGSGRFWSGLEPDLVAYGVLKEPEAALFMEYDGYWRHANRYGYKKDKEKNAALFSVGPPGSWVIRIGHFHRKPMGRNSLYVKVNNWQGDEYQSLTQTLGEVVRRMLSDLRTELDPALRLRLLRHQGDAWYFQKPAGGPTNSFRKLAQKCLKSTTSAFDKQGG